MCKRDDRVRLVALGGAAFLLTCSYAICRPATESLFIEAHGSKALPQVWVVVAVVVAVAVALYNRVVARAELLRLFATISVLCAAVLACLLLGRQMALPGVHYSLYVWKDLYMVILVEVFYTYTNSVLPMRRARWLYGAFGFAAALGGLSGSFLASLLASRFGTGAALASAVPLLVLPALIFAPLARSFGYRAHLPAQAGTTAEHSAIRVLSGSRYLCMLVVLVGLVQIAVNLVDYEFNATLEHEIADVDLRTSFIAKVYGGVNGVTLALHALTGPTLRSLGVPLTLVCIPLLLAGSLAVFAASPGIGTVAVLKIASKSLDYTLFRAGKEMLYIPLSDAERTQGKALIDILAYRWSKALAAPIPLCLRWLHAATHVTVVTGGLVLAWLAVAAVVARRFRQRVSRAEELRGRAKP